MSGLCLPATSPEIVQLLTEAQTVMLQEPQTAIQTEHVLHGGMYSRTITLPPWTRLIGAFIKVPTIVITVGDGLVSVGRKAEPVRGYRVTPGSAGRKQAFVTFDSPLIITAIFPTTAKTVAEAEAEFTDEADLLMSKNSDSDIVTITGE